MKTITEKIKQRILRKRKLYNLTTLKSFWNIDEIVSRIQKINSEVYIDKLSEKERKYGFITNLIEDEELKTLVDTNSNLFLSICDSVTNDIEAYILALDPDVKYNNINSQTIINLLTKYKSENSNKNIVLYYSATKKTIRGIGLGPLLYNHLANKIIDNFANEYERINIIVDILESPFFNAYVYNLLTKRFGFVDIEIIDEKSRKWRIVKKEIWIKTK